MLPLAPRAGGPAASAFWLACSTAEGDGYGRDWNSGPDAVESAAEGCTPSIPDVHLPCNR